MKRLKFSSIFSNEFLAIRKISMVILLFGIVLLAFIWTGLFFKIDSERQIEINNKIDEISNLSSAFAENTLRTVKNADQMVLFLKYHYEKEGRYTDIPQYVKEGRITSQPFVFMGVIDETGKLAISAQVPFVPSNLKDREHFLVHKNVDSGKLFISKPVLGRSSGKWAIQMTRRVNTPEGLFNGVVVVSVDPFYFSGFYKQAKLGKNSSVELIGRDGIVRAREAAGETNLGQNMNGSAFMEKLLSNDKGNFIATSPIDGIKRIYSYQALSEYPLIVLVGVDEQEVLQSLKQRITGYFLLTLIITIVVLGFVIVLLRAAVQEQRAKEALSQARDDLEIKVELRTQELTAMNEELQSTNIEIQNEVMERRWAEEQLKLKNEELGKANMELKNAQSQIIQQEKMASIGQLAAGVAHEINNPMAFIISNLGSLAAYSKKMTQFAAAQEEALDELLKTEKPNKEAIEQLHKAIGKTKRSLKIDFITQDMEDLLKETLDGADRVKNIVQDLRGFARVANESTMANINEGIESTINIIWNEIKYKAKLKKELSEIPLTKCNIGQLNQVFMNILVNAAQAIETQGEIRVKTWAETEKIFVSIADTGMGIPSDILTRVFDPFFTTKEVGKGTGLGLSVTYDIIKRHNGEIRVESEVGKGTTFIISIPVVQG